MVIISQGPAGRERGFELRWSAVPACWVEPGASAGGPSDQICPLPVVLFLLEDWQMRMNLGAGESGGH